MMMLWFKVADRAPARLSGTDLERHLDAILEVYGSMKVVEGVLCHGSSIGLSPLKNPSERRCGSVRFRKLCGEAEIWRMCCRQLAPYFEQPRPISLPQVLQVLGDAGMTVYDGKRVYKNLRLLRGLGLMLRRRFEDSREAWEVWRSMSNHMVHATERLGVWTYEEALRFRNAPRGRTGEASYDFNDFICFVCLQGDVVEDED